MMKEVVRISLQKTLNAAYAKNDNNILDLLAYTLRLVQAAYFF